jgi:hypothetical protein
MKQLIKKILKEETLKQTLKNEVKEEGWEETAKLVDGYENLKKLGFNNNPVEYLNVFSDLKKFRSFNDPDCILFRYKEGENILIYDRYNNVVKINNQKIWFILRHEFNLSYSDIIGLTKDWLEYTYGIKDISTTEPLTNHYINII